MSANTDVLSIDDLLASAAARLRAAGVESPRREARLLLAHVLDVGQEDIVAGSVPPLMPQQAEAFEVLLKRREAREPLAYILGVREFWSLEFIVGPGVLVPRPESELLVEQALKSFPDRNGLLRVLDLGTGSGCLLLAFLSERPSARGLGIDRSEAALNIAQENAARLQLSRRAQFAQSDWFENVSSIFDVILVNPPYIPESALDDLQAEVQAYEPWSALDGGPDGLDAYRKIALGIEGHMARGGRAFFEVGQGQAEAVASLLAQEGLSIEGTVCDLAGIPRCVIAART
jgi:release factor glutamine methyltransferase